MKKKQTSDIVEDCLTALLMEHDPQEDYVIDMTINSLFNYLINICKFNVNAVIYHQKTRCKLLGKDINILSVLEDEFNDYTKKKDKPLLN